MADELVTAALRYAELGWPTLPLEVDGKRPVTRHGVYDATIDADLIRRWWADDRHYNVGIAVPAAVVVIDVDPRNGGVDTLRSLVRELGKLPNTAVAETRSGGLHVWLRTTWSADRTQGRLGPGVDVKKIGGYVVAPPSRVEPGQYRWRHVHPPARVPQRWARRLQKFSGVRTQVPVVTDPAEIRQWTGAALRCLRAARDGNRNNVLNGVAWQLAIRGCLTDQARAELACAAGELGLDATEIYNTIASARVGAQRRQQK